MTPEDKRLLNELAVTSYGKALQKFLDAEFDLINDVQTCGTFEELLGRKRTLQTLERLFAFMKPQGAEHRKTKYD